MVFMGEAAILSTENAEADLVRRCAFFLALFDGDSLMKASTSSSSPTSACVHLAADLVRPCFDPCLSGLLFVFSLVPWHFLWQPFYQVHGRQGCR